jgi:flagellar motor switch protein FliN/FliY
MSFLASTSLEIDSINNLTVTITAVAGKATVQISQMLRLGRGAIIELDRKLGEPVDIYINNRWIAKGELVIMEHQKIGISMTELAKEDIKEN